MWLSSITTATLPRKRFGAYWKSSSRADHLEPWSRPVVEWRSYPSDYPDEPILTRADSSRVEQVAHNHLVGGSNPPRPIFFLKGSNRSRDYINSQRDKWSVDTPWERRMADLERA